MNDQMKEYLCHMTDAEKKAYNAEYYRNHKNYWQDYYSKGQTVGRQKRVTEDNGKTDYWREYYGTTPKYIHQHGYERRKQLSDWENKYAKAWDEEYANPLSEIHTPQTQMALAVDRKIELDKADRTMNKEFNELSKGLKKRYKELMNSDYDTVTKASGTIAYGKREVALLLEKANWKATKLKTAIKGLGKNPFK